MEPLFHPDSYGYRPGKSALDAVGKCRERCWRRNWVIDLDIKAFFDTVDHELVMKAVSRHTNEKWVLLYVERWLKAPLQQQDGTEVDRDRGTPQGSAISPLLANIFMHYVFDRWMGKNFPNIWFERYADDVVVHCTTKVQAERMKTAIQQRLADCKLELHPTKSVIVYCKDSNRKGAFPDAIKFDFLGYTFQPRKSVNKDGECFVNFTPGVSAGAKKRISRTIRSWHLHQWNRAKLSDIAHAISAQVRGWINYYGHFRPSALFPVLRRINIYIFRWAMRKYKRLHRSKMRALRFIQAIALREPSLFAHWTFGVKPDGWTMGAG